MCWPSVETRWLVLVHHRIHPQGKLVLYDASWRWSNISFLLALVESVHDRLANRLAPAVDEDLGLAALESLLELADLEGVLYLMPVNLVEQPQGVVQVVLGLGSDVLLREGLHHCHRCSWCR